MCTRAILLHPSARVGKVEQSQKLEAAVPTILSFVGLFLYLQIFAQVNCLGDKGLICILKWRKVCAAKNVLLNFHFLEIEFLVFFIVLLVWQARARARTHTQPTHTNYSVYTVTSLNWLKLFHNSETSFPFFKLINKKKLEAVILHPLHSTHDRLSVCLACLSNSRDCFANSFSSVISVCVWAGPWVWCCRRR